MLVLGCWRLRSVLAEDADHYNVHRPHRALGQAPPLGPAEPPVVVPAWPSRHRPTLRGNSFDSTLAYGLEGAKYSGAAIEADRA
jgi:hypothetical protein